MDAARNEMLAALAAAQAEVNDALEEQRADVEKARGEIREARGEMEAGRQELGEMVEATKQEFEKAIEVGGCVSNQRLDGVTN